MEVSRDLRCCLISLNLLPVSEGWGWGWGVFCVCTGCNLSLQGQAVLRLYTQTLHIELRLWYGADVWCFILSHSSIRDYYLEDWRCTKRCVCVCVWDFQNVSLNRHMYRLHLRKGSLWKDVVRKYEQKRIEREKDGETNMKRWCSANTECERCKSELNKRELKE